MINIYDSSTVLQPKQWFKLPMKAEINALHKMHNFHINNTKFITIGIIKRFPYRSIKILTGLFFYDSIDNIRTYIIYDDSKLQ